MTILYFSSKVASFIEGSPDTDSLRFNDHFFELVVCKIERLRGEPVKFGENYQSFSWKLIRKFFKGYCLSDRQFKRYCRCLYLSSNYYESIQIFQLNYFGSADENLRSGDQ